MTKPNFHHIISLDQETEVRVQDVQKDAKDLEILITFIAIFKEGLRVIEKKIKELQNKGGRQK